MKKNSKFVSQNLDPAMTTPQKEISTCHLHIKQRPCRHLLFPPKKNPTNVAKYCYKKYDKSKKIILITRN